MRNNEILHIKNTVWYSSYYHDYYTVEWQRVPYNFPKNTSWRTNHSYQHSQGCNLIPCLPLHLTCCFQPLFAKLHHPFFLHNLIFVLSLRHAHQAVVHVSLPVVHARYNLCQILTYIHITIWNYQLTQPANLDP